MSIDPVRWLIEASAHASDTLLDRTRGRVLLVARVFGNHVVDWLHLPRGAHVHIGDGDDVLGAPLPMSRYRLVEGHWRGWTMALDPAWDVSIVDAEGAVALVDALVDCGRARLCPDGLLRVELPDDAHAVVRIGLVAFVLRTAWPARTNAGSVTSETDPTLAYAAGFFGLLAVLVGLGFWHSNTRTSVSTQDVHDDALSMLLREVDWEDAPVVELLDTEKLRVGEGRGALDESTEGRQRGGGQTPPPEDALPVESIGPLSALREEAFLKRLLDGPSLDADALEGPHAVRVPLGSTLSWGLRTRSGPIGTTGGVSSENLGLGGLGGGHHADRLSDRGNLDFVAQLQDPIVLGALDTDQVNLTEPSQVSQIRYCLPHEFTKNPEFSGRVVVKFVIAKDGSVSSASIKPSTLNNIAAEKCILERFRRFQFPKPKDGGIVIVSYPFIFAPE